MNRVATSLAAIGLVAALCLETGEELPYSVFVSSKVKNWQKAPLILALRGYTGTTLTFVRGSGSAVRKRPIRRHSPPTAKRT